jgi:hypothetical protein
MDWPSLLVSRTRLPLHLLFTTAHLDRQFPFPDSHGPRFSGMDMLPSRGRQEKNSRFGFVLLMGFIRLTHTQSRRSLTQHLFVGSKGEAETRGARRTIKVYLMIPGSLDWCLVYSLLFFLGGFSRLVLSLGSGVKDLASRLVCAGCEKSEWF